MLANPAFTLHFKLSIAADLPANAAAVTDPDNRRAIFTPILTDLGGTRDQDTWVEGRLLLVVNFHC